MKFGDRPHVVVVVTIVVVRVTIVEVHVPRAPLRARYSAVALFLTLNESTQTFSLRKLLPPGSRGRRATRLHTRNHSGCGFSPAA